MNVQVSLREQQLVKDPMTHGRSDGGMTYTADTAGLDLARQRKESQQADGLADWRGP